MRPSVVNLMQCLQKDMHVNEMEHLQEGASVWYSDVKPMECLKALLFENSSLNITTSRFSLKWCKSKAKGKDHPRTGHEGPDGE